MRVLCWFLADFTRCRIRLAATGDRDDWRLRMVGFGCIQRVEVRRRVIFDRCERLLSVETAALVLIALVLVDTGDLVLYAEVRVRF